VVATAEEDRLSFRRNPAHVVLRQPSPITAGRERWDKNSAYAAGGGKTGEPPGVKAPAARLCSSRVDWPAQPSLNLAQNYFSRISWIVSIVLYPIIGLLDERPGARKREPAHDRPMPDLAGATFDHPQIAPTAA